MTGTHANETGNQEQDLAAPGSPAWWAARQGREEPARRPPVTLAGIVAGALELIDREGLAALSMRNLAAELQTGTTTLYRYVSGKDEVLVLVADVVLGEARFRRPVEGLGWRPFLEELARSIRTVLSAHPNIAALLATAIPVGPNSLRARELALGVLRDRGFDRTLAADVYTALAHQVFASVLQETTNDFRTGGLGASKGLTLRDFYRSLPAEEFPQLVELADALTSRTGTEEFEFGLGCLLDGVELRLRRATEPQS
ncbi:TetR/AcrR family transcriptional regulator [Streptomyces sp. NBC_01244]|uniref:TetR/AcrR family transcriptional regulator n=1 Tax=Streptomyces sp. NBC_01244 TaxID=2903797 RepID=UPI002E11D9F2|nr:TetR/AcrR family transcriptional regulator [Streptomyces sp. NBC_01244]